MENVLFESWQTLARVIMSAIFVYIFIVVLHKIAGKRATSQLNNFDWVVTVMMGAIGGQIILSNIPMTEGMASIITLLLMQYTVTKYSSISPAFASVIISEPTAVFYQGQFLYDAMRKERLTRQEIECAMRSSGIHNFDDVAAVIFESDAQLTVIPKRDKESRLDGEGNLRRSDTLDVLG